jgi:hypothetical protein
MGNDSALPVLSDRNKPLYSYFKQLFAQVTNPPIDPIREQLVMSLVSFIGPKPNLLDINNINPPMRLEVSQPVLDFKDMAKIRRIENYASGKFRSHELDICYPVGWGNEGVEARLASLCAQAVDAVKSGHNILVLTDRALDAERLALGDLVGDPEALVSRWAREAHPSVEAAFARTREAIEREMTTVEEALAALDPPLRAAAAAARGRALHPVAGLHEKALRALKKRDQGRAERLRRTRDALVPGGALQERGLGLVGVLGRHGLSILPELEESLDPFARGHQVVRL